MKIHFEEIEYHLIKEIKSAQFRLLIAVAWLTNQKIAEALIDLKNRDIDIEIIVDDNPKNRGNRVNELLISNGLKINYIKISGGPYTVMHNKFCVVDNKTFITGSYNWTNNANANSENIVILSDSGMASSFAHEFRRILTAGKSHDNVTLDKNDCIKITNILIGEFKELLKIEVNKGDFTSGIISMYNNEKTKNRIREIQEEVVNNLKEKAGPFTISLELFKKYGYNFKQLATEEQMAEERDKFRTSTTENHERNVNLIFQELKLKALELLIGQYVTRFQKLESDEQVERYMNVFQFLLNEKKHLETMVKEKPA